MISWELMYWAFFFTSFGFHVSQADSQDWDHLSPLMRAVMVIYNSVLWPILLFQLFVVLLICFGSEVWWWDYRRRRRLLKAAEAAILANGD